MNGPQVREMTLADCKRVAEIRVGGRLWAYRGATGTPRTTRSSSTLTPLCGATVR
jgi:hypothetical protein